MEKEIKQLMPQSLTALSQKSQSKEIVKYELEGEELMVANNHKINHPIRKFDTNQKAELIKRLASISESVGVKVINKEPIKFIVEILEQQYGDFTLQDLDTAFKFAFAGKLNVDIEHFQSFDATYVCPILNAYRDHRNKILLKQQQLYNQKKLAEEKRIDINDPELQKQSYENLLKFVEQNKKLPLGWNWEMVFHHLERVGLINDTTEEKLHFMTKVKEDLKEDCRGNLNRLKQVMQMPFLKTECRKRRVQKYLEKYL